jgi:hypothetical protein
MEIHSGYHFCRMRIDVHKDVIVATIRKNNKDIKRKALALFTSSLIDLSNWCKLMKRRNEKRTKTPTTFLSR